MKFLNKYIRAHCEPHFLDQQNTGTTLRATGRLSVASEHWRMQGGSMGSTEPPFCVRADGNNCAHARELLTRTLAFYTPQTAMYKPLRHSPPAQYVASYNTDECIRDDLRTPEITKFSWGGMPPDLPSIPLI